MKKRIIFIVTISITFLLVSCGKYKDVQEEILHYYNEEWLPTSLWYERQMSGPDQKIRDIIFDRRDEQDPEIIKIREEEILPVVKEAIERFKSIQPKHKKVKKLNDLQIELYELERDSDKAVIDHARGHITKDEMYEIRGELWEKREAFDDYIEELLYKYNLEHDGDKGHGFNLYELVNSVE